MASLRRKPDDAKRDFVSRVVSLWASGEAERAFEKLRSYKKLRSDYHAMEVMTWLCEIMSSAQLRKLKAQDLKFEMLLNRLSLKPTDAFLWIDIHDALNAFGSDTQQGRALSLAKRYSRDLKKAQDREDIAAALKGRAIGRKKATGGKAATIRV